MMEEKMELVLEMLVLYIPSQIVRRKYICKTKKASIRSHLTLSHCTYVRALTVESSIRVMESEFQHKRLYYIMEVCFES